MKLWMVTKSRKFPSVLIILFFCGLIITDVFAAQAGQILLNGRVKSIELATNTVVVTDYEGKDFKLILEDAEIIAKFKDRRIKVGDDVNVKYLIKDGRNVPFSLRKIAGC